MNRIHTAKTLLSYSKKELADYCIMLEKNNEVLRDTFEVQYANCIKMIEDMKILNETLEKARNTALDASKFGIEKEPAARER